MENLIRDARYGLRLLARSPIFTATAVLSLALGIGANAAIFHLIDSLTLRSPYAWAAVMVRSELPVGAISAPIARRVEQLNPSIATHVMELKARVRERLVGERVVAWLAAAFGVLATVLVVAGLYGIIAYLVVSRRNEIGIRLSLGATRAQIVRLVLRDNLWLLGVGLAIGLPLAVGVMRSAGAFLFGLTPMDVPTVVAATGLLALAGLLAGAVPAWRAAQVRPEVALRCE